MSILDQNTIIISNITVKNVTALLGGGMFDIVVSSDFSTTNKYLTI